METVNNIIETQNVVVNCTSIKGESVWNAASSWEEKDCTEWAVKLLPSLFSSIPTIELGDISIYVSSIENVNGNAYVNHSRGKKRYFYDFSLTISLGIMDSSCTAFKGKLKVDDIVNDQIEDAVFSLSMMDPLPSKDILDKVRKYFKGKTAVDFLKSVMVRFDEEYRSFI